jgi:hypothetical protein
MQLVNREKRLKILFIALLLGNLNQQAFPQTIEKIRKELFQLGFENLRIIQTEGKLTICIENITYRWQVLSISESLDRITGCLTEPVDLELLYLEKGIPKLLMQVGSVDWKNFRNGNLSTADFSSKLSISANIGDTWDKLKNIKAENRSAGKFDFILYPQFAFRNTLLKKLYEIQLNIAPALEFTMWKGMKFTGQLIIPIVNELGFEGDFIRPGYMTMSQEFRLPKQWFVTTTAGNFSNTRYGFDLLVKHPFKNEKWSVELNTGLTGSSHFFDYKWTRSDINTLTWSSSVSYFYPRFNIRMKAGAAQYIYNDRGLFASCTRYYGETAFGFYAMVGENYTTGGFNITVPFPIRQRSNRKMFRVSIPKYFEIDYDAGAEFPNGQSYSTKPDQNRINDNNFPDYLKNEIIHLNK